MRKIIRKTGINKCCVDSTKSCNRVENKTSLVYIATVRHTYSKWKNAVTLRALKSSISASSDVEGAWPNSDSSSTCPTTSTKYSTVVNLACSSGASSHLEKLILCIWDMRDSNLFFVFLLVLEPEHESSMIYKPGNFFFCSFLSGHKSSLTSINVLFQKQ